MNVLREETPASTASLAWTDCDLLVATAPALRRACAEREADGKTNDALATLLKDARVLWAVYSGYMYFGKNAFANIWANVAKPGQWPPSATFGNFLKTNLTV